MDRAVPVGPSRRVAFVVDALVVLAAYLGVLVLRFQGEVPSSYGARFAALILLIAATYSVAGLLVSGSTGSIVRIYAASAFLVIVGNQMTSRPIPPSVATLGGICSVLALIGWRSAAKAWIRRSEP
jgi:hypothetical protein